MKCAAVRALAGPYVLDAAAEWERQAVDRHLDDCPACRAYVAELSEAAGSLVALVPAQAPPLVVKERVLAAARPVPEEGAAPYAPGARRRRPLWRAAVQAAAAAALVALGWAAGRIWPALPASPSPGEPDPLTRLRLERDLWQALSSPGTAVMPLVIDRSLPRAVAYAAVLGDQEGCWVRLVAEGLPAPPAGMHYAVWVSTRSGEMRFTGRLMPLGPGRWELAARVDIPPTRLGILWVLRQLSDAAAPAWRQPVAWGELWPEGYEW